jgi:fructoselysine 6-kinase
VELVRGDRVFGDYNEGVLASFKLKDEDIDFICGHDLAFSGVWGNCHDDLWKIRARGTPVVFDFDGKLDGPVAAKAIGDVDYAFFASDEGDSADLRRYMESAHRRGPKIVTVTLGSHGSIAYDGEQFVTFGIVACDVKDTLGAGDSYIAGFVKGILEKRPLKECMSMGAASSSATLQYMGAW